MGRVELFAFPSYQSLFVSVRFLAAIFPNSRLSQDRFAVVTTGGGTQERCRAAARNLDRKLPTLHCVFPALRMNRIPERAASHRKLLQGSC